MFHFMPLSKQSVYEEQAIYRRFNADNGIKGNVEQVLLIQSSGYIKPKVKKCYQIFELKFESPALLRSYKAGNIY